MTLTLRGGQTPGKLPEQLNVRQIELLNRMRPGEKITITSLRKSTGEESMSERTARNDLTGLVKLGFLVRQAQGKNTFYIRTEKPIA